MNTVLEEAEETWSAILRGFIKIKTGSSDRFSKSLNVDE